MALAPRMAIGPGVALARGVACAPCVPLRPEVACAPVVALVPCVPWGPRVTITGWRRAPRRARHVHDVVVAAGVLIGRPAEVLGPREIRVDIESHIGATGRGAVDGRDGIDETRALLEDTVGELALRGDGGTRR